jgi:hypothetical protein
VSRGLGNAQRYVLCQLYGDSRREESAIALADRRPHADGKRRANRESVKRAVHKLAAAGLAEIFYSTEISSSSYSDEDENSPGERLWVRITVAGKNEIEGWLDFIDKYGEYDFGDYDY